MSTGATTGATTYSAAAGGQQTVLTTTNPTRLTELGVTLHASVTQRVTVKLFINTYTYLTFPLDPGEGAGFQFDAFVAGSTGIQIAADAAAQNLMYFKLSGLDDVNTPASGPTVTGSRGYHTAGAGSAQTIWTPPATQSRLVEVAFANISATTTYRFTLYHGAAGYPYYSARLGPGEALPIKFGSMWVGTTALALVTDAPASTTQWHYTAIEDIQNAQGAAS